MSYFVYISHREHVDALIVAKTLMESGHYPFVPQLNRLISGRKDPEWENYFKMWLFRCDCIFLTQSFRDHEKEWATSNEIPVIHSMKGLRDLKLPPFGDVGAEFGKALADLLPKDESWRKQSKEETLKELTDIAGLGAHPLPVGLAAMKVWDRQNRG